MILLIHRFQALLEDGHDAAWLGTTRFTLFRNRLDRAFACDRYAVGSGNADTDIDLLYAELSERDIDSMPRLDPGLVRRLNLNGSPGWVHRQRRFLLASGEFGKLDQLPWPQKSWTKQRVARQPDPDPEPSLFDDFADDEIGGLMAAVDPETELDIVTYVVAHSLDAVGRQVELVFGRPQLNSGGGQAWRWRQSLLETPPTNGGRRTDDSPLPTGPTSEPDAPVRLRRPSEDERRRPDSGEQ